MTDLQFIAKAYMIFDKGEALNKGLKYSENNGVMSIIYDGVTVPHIYFQEKGFRHWLSGKIVDVNKGFIANKTVGAIRTMLNASESEKSVLMATNAQTVQSRQSQMSQGFAQENKGHERGNSNVYF
jgi:hypothetical protein